MSAPKLPAFETLLKSREVEDPVNLWVHRPLAYGFVALVYRSPVTPNQITLLAMLVGIVAGLCFIEGSRTMMLWGGALMWTSAILDGADGILARAQRSFSELGRALDGTADMVVAVATVLPAGYHLWTTRHEPSLFVLLPLAIFGAVFHIELYDFYKESYLQMTNPHWDGKPERVADAEARLARVKAEGLGLTALIASYVYVDLVRAQTRIVARTNPSGSREGLDFKVSDESVAIYRRHNRGPMQLWAMISLAPHSYTMAILAMLDQVQWYLWLRLVLCNVLFAIVLVWQRRASQRTRADLEAAGLGPLPAVHDGCARSAVARPSGSARLTGVRGRGETGPRPGYLAIGAGLKGWLIAVLRRRKLPCGVAPTAQKCSSRGWHASTSRPRLSPRPYTLRSRPFGRATASPCQTASEVVLRIGNFESAPLRIRQHVASDGADVIGVTQRPKRNFC